MRRFTARCEPDGDQWVILINGDDIPEIATQSDLNDYADAEDMARDAIESYLCAVEGDDADLSFELTIEFEE